MSYIKRIFIMLVSPQRAWSEISEEHPTGSECAKYIFAPMLAIEILITVASFFVWHERFDIERSVFQIINILFRTVGGYYIVKYLAYKFLEFKCPGEFLSDDSAKVVSYGFVTLMLTDSIVIILGNQLILYVLYFSIALQYNFAFKKVLNSDEERRPQLTAVYFCLTVGIPNLIRYILVHVLTNAPIE